MTLSEQGLSSFNSSINIQFPVTLKTKNIEKKTLSGKYQFQNESLFHELVVL